MARSGKWWTLCVVSLSCVAWFGSCNRHGAVFERVNESEPDVLHTNTKTEVKNSAQIASQIASQHMQYGL